MLEYAFDEEGRLTHIKEAVAKNHSYFCPECNEALIVKNRDFKERVQEKYFAHSAGSQCDAGHGGGEGDIHRNTKFLIYAYLKKIDHIILWMPKDENGFRRKFTFLSRNEKIALEKNTIEKLRPDISILDDENNLQTAVEIEYKHPDSDEKTESYRENKIDVVRVYTDENIYNDLQHGGIPKFVIDAVNSARHEERSRNVKFRHEK